MNRNYHLDCVPLRKVPTKTSFDLRRTNKYTRSYYKSCSNAKNNLYQGIGCWELQNLVNPNFRIPRANRNKI